MSNWKEYAKYILTKVYDSIKYSKELQPALHFLIKQYNLHLQKLNKNERKDTPQISILIQKIKNHVNSLHKFFANSMTVKQKKIICFRYYIDNLKLLQNDSILMDIKDCFLKKQIVSETLLFLHKFEKSQNKKGLKDFIMSIYSYPDIIQLFQNEIFSIIHSKTSKQKTIQSYLTKDEFIFYFIVNPDQLIGSDCPPQISNILLEYFLKQIKGLNKNFQYVIQQVYRIIYTYKMSNGMINSKLGITSIKNLQQILIYVMKKIINIVDESHGINIKSLQTTGEQSFWVKILNLHTQVKIYESIVQIIKQKLQTNLKIGAYLYKNFIDNKQKYYRNNKAFIQDFEQLFKQKLQSASQNYKIWIQILFSMSLQQSEHQYLKGKYEIFYKYLNSDPRWIQQFYDKYLILIKQKKYELKLMRSMINNIPIIIKSNSLDKFNDTLQKILQIVKDDNNKFNQNIKFINQIKTIYKQFSSLIDKKNSSYIKQNIKLNIINKLNNSLTEIQYILLLSTNDNTHICEINYQINKLTHMKSYLLQLKTFIQTQFFKQFFKFQFSFNHQYLQQIRNQILNNIKLFASKNIQFSRFDQLFRYANSKYLKQYIYTSQISAMVSVSQKDLILSYNLQKPPISFLFKQNKFIEQVFSFQTQLFKKSISDQNRNQLIQQSVNYDQAYKRVKQKCNEETIGKLLFNFNLIKTGFKNVKRNIFREEKYLQVAKIYFQYWQLFKLAFKTTQQEKICLQDYITQQADSDIQILQQFLHIVKECLIIKTNQYPLLALLQGNINDLSCYQCSKSLNQIKTKLKQSKNTSLDFKQNAKKIILYSKFYIKPTINRKWMLICDFNQEQNNDLQKQKQKQLMLEQEQRFNIEYKGDIKPKQKEKDIVDMFTLKHYRDKLSVFVQIKQNYDDIDKKIQKIDSSFCDIALKLDKQDKQKLQTFTLIFSQIQEIQHYTLSLIENGYFPNFFQNKKKQQLQKQNKMNSQKQIKMNQISHNKIQAMNNNQQQRKILLFEINNLKEYQVVNYMQQKKNQFKKMHQQWKEFLVELWENYLSACLCNGKVMNSLIQKILIKQPINQLKSIVKDAIQFKNQYNILQNPKKTYKQLFSLIQQKLTDKIKKGTKSALQHNSRVLVYHQKVQDWYPIMLSVHPQVTINDILFCKQTTTKHDIQRFLCRMLKCNSYFYFILASSQLKMQVQTYLLQNVLNNYQQKYSANLRKSNISIHYNNVCFIDSSRQHKIYQVLYYTSRINKQLIKYQQIQNIEINKYINNLKIYYSKYPSCGKTFKIINQIQNKKKLKPQYILFSGEVTQQYTYELLKQLNTDQPSALIIQISYVKNIKTVNKILSQIIFFKTIQENLFSLTDKHAIYIEIQNLQRINLIQSIPILKYLYQVCPDIFVQVKQFTVQSIIPDIHNQQFILVIKTLQLINNNKIKYDIIKRQQHLSSQQQYFFTNQIIQIKDKGQFESVQVVPQYQQLPQQWKNLLKKYLFQKMNNQVSAILYKYYIKKLYQNFCSFYKCRGFDALSFYQSKIQNKMSRKQLLQLIIDNTLSYLKQYFQTGQISRNNQAIQTFRSKIKDFPLLIYPLQLGNYIFPFKNQQTVPQYLQQFIKVQECYRQQKLTSYNIITQLKQVQQMVQIQDKQQIDQKGNKSIRKAKQLKKVQKLFQKRIKKTFFELYGIDQTKLQLIKNHLINVFQLPYNFKFESSQYKLTDDNFFKILVLMYRFSCQIPTNIMGLSGVGKTRLIKQISYYLNNSKLYGNKIKEGNTSKQQNILNQKKQQNKNIQQKDKQNNKQNNKQQINTINKILQYHQHIQFVSLYLHSGIKKAQLDLFLRKHNIYDSAVNKWILLDQFNTTQQIGLIKTLIQDRIYKGKQISNKIFFITACNPYKKLQSLQRSQDTIGLRFKKNIKDRQNLEFHVYSYPQSMGKYTIDFQQLSPEQVQKYSKSIFQDLKIKKSDQLSRIVSVLHKEFYDNIGQSSVSLRDVQRLARLYKWFQTKSQVLKLDQSKIHIVSMCTCYLAKTYSKQLKNKILKSISISLNIMQQKIIENYEQIQKQFIDQMIGLQNIAKNRPLIQNVFFLIISFMVKLPVLIIGAPGSSKSLSISLVQTNLKGSRSQSEFFRKFPQVKIKRYQASQTSSSNAIKKKYEELQKCYQNDKQNCVYALIIDQIGLAEYSPDNPLKVLHQFTQLTNDKYTTIGIGNWRLDQSKMSRFLVCERNMPTNQELKQTTLQIMRNYIKDDNPKLKLEFLAQCLAIIYDRFTQNWRKNEIYVQFFGLRDYYFFLKNIFKEFGKLTQPDNKKLAEIINEGIKIYFNGQVESIKIFRDTCFTQNKQLKNQVISEVINLDHKINSVKQCLRLLQPSQDSRCIMIIYSHDLVVPFINRIISQQRRKVMRMVTLHGSFFQNDIQNQEYNLQKIAKISSFLPKKIVLALKDFNGAIYTSYYQVFNKNYTKVGNSNITRISIGEFSNSKCQVHRLFNILLFVSQQQIKNKSIDSAAINRFTKIYFDMNEIMTQQQISILSKIQKWKDLIKKALKKGNNSYQHFNYFINSSKQSLQSLLLTFRNDNEFNKQQKIKQNLKDQQIIARQQQQQKINKIKRVLMRNRILQVDLALKFDQMRDNNILQQLRRIIQQQKQIIPQYQYRNKIIYTYDPQAQFFNNIQENNQKQQKKDKFKMNQQRYQDQNYTIQNNNLIQQNISNIKQQSQMIRILNRFYLNKNIKLLILKFNIKNLPTKILDHLFYLIKQKQQQLSCPQQLKNKQIRIIIFLDKNLQRVNPTQISYLHEFQQYYQEYPFIIQKAQRLNLTKQSLTKMNKMQQIFTSLKNIKSIQHLIRICGAYFTKSELDKSLQKYLTEQQIKYFYLPLALKSLKYKFQYRKYPFVKNYQYIWTENILSNVSQNDQLISYITKKSIQQLNKHQYTQQIFYDFINDNDIQSQSYNTIYGLKKFIQRYLLKLVIFIIKTLFQKGIINYLFIQQIPKEVYLSSYHNKSYNISTQLKINSFFKSKYWINLNIKSEQFSYKSLRVQMQSNIITIPQLSIFPFLKDVLQLITIQDTPHIDRENNRGKKTGLLCLQKQCKNLKQLYVTTNQLENDLQNLGYQLIQLQKQNREQYLQRIKQIRQQINKLPQKINDTHNNFKDNLNQIQKIFSQSQQVQFTKNIQFFDDNMKQLLLLQIFLSLDIKTSLNKTQLASVLIEFTQQVIGNIQFRDQLIIILINFQYIQTIAQIIIVSGIQPISFFKLIGNHSQKINQINGLVPKTCFETIQNQLSTILFHNYLCFNKQNNQITYQQANAYFSKFNSIYLYIYKFQSISISFELPQQLVVFNKLANQCQNISDKYLNLFINKISLKISQNLNRWISIAQSINQIINQNQFNSCILLQLSAFKIFPLWLQNIKQNNKKQIDQFLNQLKNFIKKKQFLKYSNYLYLRIFIGIQNPLIQKIENNEATLSAFINHIQQSFDFSVVVIQNFRKIISGFDNIQQKKRILISLQNFSYSLCKKGKFGDLRNVSNQSSLSNIIKQLLQTDLGKEFYQNIKWGVIKYYLELYSDAFITQKDIDSWYVNLIQKTLDKSSKISKSMMLYTIKILLKKFNNNLHALHKWMYEKQRGGWTKKQQIQRILGCEQLQNMNMNNEIQIIRLIKKEVNSSKDFSIILKRQWKKTQQVYELLTYSMLQIYNKKQINGNNINIKYKWIQTSKQLYRLLNLYTTQKYPLSIFNNKQKKNILSQKTEKFFLNIINWIISFISTNNYQNPFVKSLLFHQIENKNNFQNKLNQIYVLNGLQHPLIKQLQYQNQQIIIKCSKQCGYYFKYDSNQYNNGSRFICQLCQRNIQNLDQTIILGPLQKIKKLYKLQNNPSSLSEQLQMFTIINNTPIYQYVYKYYINEQKNYLSTLQNVEYKGYNIQLKGYNKVMSKQLQQITRISKYTKSIIRIIQQTYYHMIVSLKWSDYLSQQQKIDNWQQLIGRYSKLKQQLMKQRIINKQILQVQDCCLDIVNKIFIKMINYDQQMDKLLLKQKNKIRQLINLANIQKSHLLTNNTNNNLNIQLLNTIINDLNKHLLSIKVNKNIKSIQSRNQCQQLINSTLQQSLIYHQIQSSLLNKNSFNSKYQFNSINQLFIQENTSIKFDHYQVDFKNIWATSLMKNHPNISHNIYTNHQQWLSFYKHQVQSYNILKLIFNNPNILIHMKMAQIILTYLTAIFDQIDTNYTRDDIKKLKLNSLFEKNTYLRKNFDLFSKQLQQCMKIQDLSNQQVFKYVDMSKINHDMPIINFIGDDRQVLKNQLSILKIIQFLAELYNSNYNRLLNSFPYKSSFKIKPKYINPVKVYPGQLFDINLQKVIYKIQNQAAYQVEYGQTYYVYAFGNIQDGIYSELCKVQNLLISKTNEIRKPLLKNQHLVRYTVEKLDSLTQLWKSSEQIQITDQQRRNKIKNVLKQSMKKDKLTKQNLKYYMKKILSCIQLCIIKYVSAQPKRRQKVQTKLTEFIRSHRDLRKIQKQVQQQTTENIFEKNQIKQIKISQILSFHDLVQQQLYEFIQQSLDGKYRQPFTEQKDIQIATNFVNNKLKSNQFGEHINLRTFYEALCKLALFNFVSSDDRFNDKKITQLISTKQYYWPRKIKFLDINLFNKFKIDFKVNNFKDFFKIVQSQMKNSFKSNINRMNSNIITRPLQSNSIQKPTNYLLGSKKGKKNTKQF